MFNSVLGIVIIDDDSLIRNALKILFWAYFKNPSLKLYSSEDGVDGLGLIFVANPQIIIIDSTLPKYSGREIIEFLITNEKFVNKKVFVLNDGSSNLETLPANYTVINKKSGKFVDNIMAEIRNQINSGLIDYGVPKSGAKENLLKNLIVQLITYANKADVIMHKITTSKNILFKSLYLLPWFLLQIFSSVLYSLIILISPQIVDSNIRQAKSDLKTFRVKAYPTLATILIALIFLIFQFFLFLVGGIVIFNSIRIDSIFASSENNVSFDFTQAQFDNTKIEYANGKIQLKQISETVTLEADTSLDPVSFPTIEQTQIRTYYPSTSPSVLFNQKIPFNKLIAIYEESNFNNSEESIPDINIESGKRKVQTQESFKSRQIGTNVITYQLSPDNSNWYYYGSELKWERTVNEFTSSNTIQEVNQFLKFYQEQVGGSDLYMRAYLISDGDTPIELRALIVERSLGSISNLSSINYEEETPIVNEIESFDPQVSNANQVQIEVPQPTIFSVSYLDGKNIVYGKILNSDISDIELSNFKVRVYETSSTTTSVNAENKGVVIGEIGIEKNIRGELTFLLNSVGPKSEFVTAQLIYTNQNNQEFFSNLSKPIGN